MIAPIDPRFPDLIPPSSRLVRLATGTKWAEGPVYRFAAGDLLWSDIPNDRIMRWSAEDGVSVWRHPSGFANGHTLDLEGRLLSCEHGRRRISRTEAGGAVVGLVDRHRGGRLNSPNDVVVKSDGTIWFTDPPYGIIGDEEGHRADSEQGDVNHVFRFDPATGRLDAVSDAMGDPNGLAFSPDEALLYVSDTSAVRHGDAGSHHIVVFDVIDGTSLANLRVFAEITPGLADGFRVDEHGNLFTSAGDGIQVFAPDGTRLGTIPVPETTSNCVFGGPEGRTLFVTATTSLYSIETATRGATVHRHLGSVA